MAFVVIDYLREIHGSYWKATFERGRFSEASSKGDDISLVAIGHIIDSQLIQTGSAIRTAVIFFYLSNEGISIIENTAKIGLPVPEKLTAVLEQLNKEDK